MTSGPLIPMIGYARVSYVGGREEILSPKIQQDEGGRWAPPHGYRIVRWIIDLDETGRNFDRDVALAIGAVVSEEVAAIGVYNYARWGRDTRDCLNNLKRVTDAGGDVISWTEPFDSETAIGIFGRTMAFAVAELQSRQIGEGWQRAHANRVGRGLPPDGGARFGYVRLGRIPDETRKNAYRRDPDDPLGERYVPDPVTGPLLAGLYARDVAGEGRRALVWWLNSHGILTASGGHWTRDSLNQVLASGFGAGLLRVHDPACRRKPERGKPKCPRTVYVPGAHEPVIRPEAWDAFLARQEARRDTPVRLRDPVHPYSGLLACGSTGHRLTVSPDGGGVAYRCPRRAEGRDCEGAYVRETAVEEAVLGWLSGWARDIEAAAAAEAARLRATARAQVTGDALARQEAALEKQLARLMRRWAADEHAEPRAYEIARKGIEEDLEAVRGRMRDAQRARAANAGAYQPVVTGLIGGWPTFPPARRRELLGHLIARIEVHRTGARKPPRLEIVPVWEDATRS